MAKKKSPISAPNIILAGIFFGFLSIAICGSLTVISVMEMAKVVACFSFVPLIIPIKFYQKWFGFNRYEVFFSMVFGIGPLVTGLLLWCNYLVPAETNTYDVRVVNARKIHGSYIESSYLRLDLEDNFMEHYPEYRQFNIGGDQVSVPNHVVYVIKHGVLGYDVVTDQQYLIGNQEINIYEQQ